MNAYIKINQKLIIIFFLIFILLPSSAKKSFGHTALDYIIGPSFLLYDDEGSFVIAPAATGGIIMAIPGSIVGFPTGGLGYCIGAPAGRGDVFFEKTTVFVIRGFCFTGGAVTGSPFYIVKKTFYDLPKWIFKKKNPVTL